MTLVKKDHGHCRLSYYQYHFWLVIVYDVAVAISISFGVTFDCGISLVDWGTAIIVVVKTMLFFVSLFGIVLLPSSFSNKKEVFCYQGRIDQKGTMVIQLLKGIILGNK